MDDRHGAPSPGPTPDRGSAPDSGRGRNGDRDRDPVGQARNARPRDGLGRPLPYGATGTPRQPEGIRRTPAGTIIEAQRLLDQGKPFHAHEVFEDAWKTGPPEERALWRGLAQLAVGLTHAARGNAEGGARLLRRGADALADWCAAGARVRPYDLDVPGLTAWARDLADTVDTVDTEDSVDSVDTAGTAGTPVDPAARAPRLRGGGAAGRSAGAP